MGITGTIFDIMKYSIHDGPGIRTTVFFKGCPLNCWWCHNPESQAPGPELMLRPERCIVCGECASVCPNGAAVLRDGALITFSDKCRDCLLCVDVCHAEARSGAGRRVTAAEVMAEITKDLIFYEESGGGVTFSGGEPLMQPDFLCSLLEQCKKREIRTAVDTTGFARLSDLLRVGPHTDLFLYDVKLMDDAAHRKYTGVTNRIILENLRELARQHSNIIVRVPVIPGVNDTEENVTATAQFVADLPGVREINLLPYHKAGVQKYNRLGKPYELPDLEPPPDETMIRLAASIKHFGRPVKIGG
ncbi:MAG TPA: glycyl-radical enzyme activating protein [Symbiobacteriaceae bacterium]|nr:glycyl-radical enzyme activating protein [Symbiobacteriaceae bacterium]